MSDSAAPTPGPVKFTGEVAAALRTTASQEQAQEEARLRKRLDRASGGVSTRQGSVVPGTPGSVAPEEIKAPTKKEQRKRADAKVNEAANHAAANTTTAQFLGGGGGIFGKKKRYNWLTGNAGGGGASGASTPGRISTPGVGTPGSLPVNAPPEKLTADGVRRLGEWRDDGPKGRRVQIRDWISVLEQDGHEKVALQKAYLGLDHSDPK